MSEVKTIICDICKRELPEHPNMKITIYKDGKNELLDVLPMLFPCFFFQFLFLISVIF